jgi:maleylacetoacetate isomerase
MFKLYNYPKSSTSYRVRIALNYKNIPYEKILINLLNNDQLSEEYKQINSAKGVPTLQIDNGKYLVQSMAILEYLEEFCPNPAILPKDIQARAYVRALANMIGCDMHPLNNLRVVKYLQNDLHQTKAVVEEQWRPHWLLQGFNAIEEFINNSGFYNGNYCCGDHVSMADICLVPQVYSAKRFNFDLSAYPNITKICNKLNNLDAFVLAAMEIQA